MSFFLKFEVFCLTITTIMVATYLPKLHGAFGTYLKPGSGTLNRLHRSELGVQSVSSRVNAPYIFDLAAFLFCSFSNSI